MNFIIWKKNYRKINKVDSSKNEEEFNIKKGENLGKIPSNKKKLSQNENKSHEIY